MPILVGSASEDMRTAWRSFAGFGAGRGKRLPFTSRMSWPFPLACFEGALPAKAGAFSTPSDEGAADRIGARLAVVVLQDIASAVEEPVGEVLHAGIVSLLRMALVEHEARGAAASIGVAVP